MAGAHRCVEQWQCVLMAVVSGSVAASSMALMFFIYWRSLWVLVREGFSPCDVPLARILTGCVLLVPVFMARTYLWRLLQRACRWSEAHDNGSVCRAVIVGLACFWVVYYTTAKGMKLVHKAATCHDTAPNLYRWATYIFPAGMLHFMLFQAIAACSYAGFTQAVGRIYRDSKGPGRATLAPLDTVRPNPGATCSICLEGYASGVMAAATPCCRNHFHTGCLQGWLKSHHTCPLCRTVLQAAALKPVDVEAMPTALNV